MDFVVFSHLGWDFVYQRPQHLLSRAARRHRVLFVEESREGDGAPRAELSQPVANVTVCRPSVTSDVPDENERETSAIVRDVVSGWARGPVIAWHYAVMAEPHSAAIDPGLVVYDCMDELSAFRGAPPALVEREAALLSRADIVFTGGPSLFEAKRERHPRVHAFPSAVDLAHFAQARHELDEPTAMRGIGRPRLVYAGVIDERLDLQLIEHVARAEVGAVVMVGPVAKLSEDELPRHRNIHYLGMQSYADLPRFFANADVALLPFALNKATEFISPTKTPEYLAAGLPVVTTPVRDVVRSYGDLPNVHVAADRDAFVTAILRALVETRTSAPADARIARSSWDATWQAMERLVETAWTEKHAIRGAVRAVAATP